MRPASHVAIKTRDYFGKTIELATWTMLSTSGGYAAGYYHGADLLFVRYGYSSEEAIDLVEKEVDRLVNP
jgi:hypothetical protein